ncbi:MAG: universal stress protein [Candidatus Caldatribacteriota bacterium]
MSFAKKIIVAVDFTNEINNLLKDMKEMSFIAGSEIQFVHVASKITYSFVFSNMPLVYPVEEDRKTIEESTIASLVKLSKEVLPENFSGKVRHLCFFSENPKQTFVEYVNAENPDLVIVATRLRKGLFESSFAHYVDKNTKANMLLIKHHD